MAQNAVPIQVPVGAEEGFKGVIDLIKMKSIVWSEENMGAQFEYADIPADLQDTCDEWREHMVEAAAEGNDELMEKYLEEGDLSEEEILTGSARTYPATRDRAGYLWLGLQE